MSKKKKKSGKAGSSGKVNKKKQASKSSRPNQSAKAGKTAKAAKKSTSGKGGKSAKAVKTVNENKAVRTAKAEKTVKAAKPAEKDRVRKTAASAEAVAAKGKNTGSAVREKKGQRAYYYDLDIVRALACAAVLLYHLGVLKGGFLAVCTFFVLSGFLSVTSALQQEEFSIKRYYGRRLVQTYLPLAAVTRITVLVITLIPDIIWLNLKPETGSVLLGYNNWWQLSVSLDYFARHVSSPFMHFWYVAIQLQFDLVFPFIFLFLKKMREKEGDQAPQLFLFMGAALSAIYMALLYDNGSVMAAYYDTFSRVHALLAGMLFGFFMHERNSREDTGSKESRSKAAVLWAGILIWVAMMVFCGPDSGAAPMILAVPLSIAIIWAGTRVRERKRIDAVFGKISGLSFEIYLVQYPVIYLVQEMMFSGWFNDLPKSISMSENTPVMIIGKIVVTVILAAVLKYAEGFRAGKNRKTDIKRAIALVAVLALASAGAVKYVLAEDHTQELKELEEQLGAIAAEMEQRQAELLERRKQEEQDWEAMLETLQNGEEGLQDAVRQLPVVGIGDSVMLGALSELYDQFPNGYFDAGTSRTSYVADGIVSYIENMGLLGDVVVFNFGANGEGPDWVREEVVDRLSDRKVFWLTNTNRSTFWVNDSIKELAASRSNLTIIDWNEISEGHDEYFISDGIHLTEEGRKAFAGAIFDSICEQYREEYQRKVDALIEEHEAQERKKTVFIGNDLLTGVFPFIDESLSDAETIVIDGDGEDVISAVTQKVSDGELPNRVVFAFDRSAFISENEYTDLIEICADHEVYIVVPDTQQLQGSAATLISMDGLDRNSYMPDMIHLTEEGNRELAEKISRLLSD